MTAARSQMKRKKPGLGCRQGNRIKVVCTFDDETFEQIRALALVEKTSLTVQIRQLVEFGLMDVEADKP